MGIALKQKVSAISAALWKNRVSAELSMAAVPRLILKQAVAVLLALK
jgi:hypothetical protein